MILKGKYPYVRVSNKTHNDIKSRKEVKMTPLFNAICVEGGTHRIFHSHFQCNFTKMAKALKNVAYVYYQQILLFKLPVSRAHRFILACTL